MTNKNQSENNNNKYEDDQLLAIEIEKDMPFRKMSLRECEISLRKAAAEIEAMELANKEAKLILEKEN